MGWEPSERHEHYDAEGNLTGYTVVTRDAEWDSNERNRMLALEMYEAQVCDCGFHESVLSDPSNIIMPKPRVCPVCAGLDGYMRVLKADDDEWDKKHKDPSPAEKRPSDGRRVSLQHLSPAEAEAERQKRKGGGQRGNSPRARSPRTPR